MTSEAHPGTVRGSRGSEPVAAGDQPGRTPSADRPDPGPGGGASPRNRAHPGDRPLAQGRVVDEPELVRIAAEHHATPAQVALAWLLADGETVAIPRSSKPHRIRENHEALAVRLSDEERAAIDTLRSRHERVIDPLSAGPGSARRRLKRPGSGSAAAGAEPGKTGEGPGPNGLSFRNAATRPSEALREPSRQPLKANRTGTGQTTRISRTVPSTSR
ncbi:MAG: aldo/keto reductase [Gammaproteobacteria bacterium]|nr:aldo/keto reductase [Gammaproteobacteria bacterium]